LKQTEPSEKAIEIKNHLSNVYPELNVLFQKSEVIEIAYPSKGNIPSHQPSCEL